MTRAEQIQALNDGKRSTRQIALAVYGDSPKLTTRMAYVRVVMRQRCGKSYCMSIHDRRYQQSDHGREANRKKSRRWAMANRDKCTAIYRRWYQERGGKAWKAAYDAAHRASQ